MKLITKNIEVVDNLATGDAVRLMRKARGISLRELSRRMGYSAAYVSDMERGFKQWTQVKLDKWIKAIKG